MNTEKSNAYKEQCVEQGTALEDESIGDYTLSC